jgi:hypothetical protein
MGKGVALGGRVGTSTGFAVTRAGVGVWLAAVAFWVSAAITVIATWVYSTDKD